MRYQLRLLFSAFFVSFLIVIGLTALSFSRINKLDARIAIVEHTYQVINTINLLSDGVQELNRTSFRYVTTGDSVFRELYRQNEYRWGQMSDSLKRLTVDNPAQQAAITFLNSDMALYRSWSAAVMDSVPYPATEFVRSAEYTSRRQNADSMTARLQRMKSMEYALLHQRTAERENYLQLTTSLIRALTLIFGLLASVLFFLLMREFRKRITFQTELQQKMAEIARSKRELEHIAYATSHDLQEPLRKIRILTDRWQSQHVDTTNESQKGLMNRITSSAARMQDLVSELMILASLNDEKPRTVCALRECAAAAAAALQPVITEKKAELYIAPLPVLHGYPDQLRLLFRHLLDNALKFAKPDNPVKINVTVRDAHGYELNAGNEAIYKCVIIEDDGVGFDNRHADKMFGIFRQLHSTGEGYKGKGTGLAICQRIMHNHGGAIVAHGFPGEGATFKLYFPVT